MSDTDIDIYRGSTLGVVWQCFADADQSVPFDFAAGSSARMVVTWRGGRMVKATGTDANFVLDRDAATVTWIPTVEESRSIPAGRLAKYDLEYRSGSEQKPLVTGGYFVGLGGLNDD